MISSTLDILSRVAPSLLATEIEDTSAAEESQKLRASRGNTKSKIGQPSSSSFSSTSSSSSSSSSHSNSYCVDLLAIMLSEVKRQDDAALCGRFAGIASLLVGDNINESIDGIVGSLLSEQHLDVQNDRLDCDLNVLGKLLPSSSHFGYSSSLLQLASFVKNSLLRSNESKDSRRKSKDKSSRSTSNAGLPAQTFRVACCGIR